MKGLGHYHSVKCKGDYECLEKSNREKCLHNDSCGKYDSLECTFYWNRYEWVPPVQMENEEKQKEFGKCNFFCGHKIHEDNKEVFNCQLNLFHTKSSDYDMHKFNCKHYEFYYYDIVFIIDSTGSMQSYFEKVKNVAENLINKWGIDYTRFAVVAFTDHNDSGRYSTLDPTDTYPESFELSEGDPKEVNNFIKDLKAMGGGPLGGEALIDALAKCNKLKFRQNSKRMFIVITDEKPHGEEFGENNIHPKGCPCGIDWRHELNEILKKDATFLFIKLNEGLTLTIDLFRGILKNSLIELELTSLESFEIEVTSKIAFSIDQQILVNKGKF